MSVTPGSDILAQDIIKSTPWYAADAGSTDAYAISLPTAPSAYSDGAVYRFKANTANTGAATLNINSLGATAIKRPDGNDVITGDILANQIVEVVYRSSAFYMTSPTSENRNHIVGALQAGLVKLYFNIHYLFILWTGSSDNDTTTTFDNWVRSSTDVEVPAGGATAGFDGTGADYMILASPFVKDKDTGTINFSDSKLIIMDWWADCGSTSTGEINMGFTNSSSGLTRAYNDTNEHKALFQQKTDGTLLAVTNRTGTGITNTTISPYTPHQWNNFRIEMNLGVDVKFYLNGVLVATHSGNTTPNIVNDVDMGFGRADSADFIVTAPYVSLKMS